jgi:hypothetical protein
MARIAPEATFKNESSKIILHEYKIILHANMT